MNRSIFVVVKRLLLIPFIALLFTGSVGIDVFKHICSKEGVSLAFIVNTVEHCEEETKDSPSCCQEEKKKDDCCDDEVDVLQFDLDFFQKLVDLSFESVDLEQTRPYFIEFKPAIDAMEELRYSSYYPPPPISSSQKRAMLQIYTI